MMFERTFLEACIDGLGDLEDLNDYIDYWQTHELNLSLREFLGMTEYEYEKWLQNDDTIIRDILRCRVDGIPFEEFAKISARKGIVI